MNIKNLTKKDLKKAVVMHEILSKPVSLRKKELNHRDKNNDRR
ncbi:hypothetical protein [Vallitalea pronyensis]|nr:hypothetical protein [Vallitalea pronyensis]